MKASWRALLYFVALVILSAPFAAGYDQRSWRIVSPDHEQTFSFGTEQNRICAQRGRDRHLVVLLTFTNDPYVDRVNPRLTDNFTFSFPGVTLGRDGHTFCYHAPRGRLIPVAVKKPDFLGIDEIHLLPDARLIVYKPHGYLTLQIVVDDLGESAAP